jgi:hypothetical protein
VINIKKILSVQHKCEHCLYLLNKEKIIECGKIHIKYNCMLSKCIKEKKGDKDG